MPEHRLPDGIKIIEGLCVLGTALNYFVEKELPVEKGKKNPQAIDVAWLSEKGQEFPLMIFEIESSVSNSVANNPTKIFGKANQTYEKPLFFFHIMVKGGTDSTRIEDLRYQFGSHNYRVYKIAENETAELLGDVLSQHRRLTSEIDFVKVATALRSHWPAHVDSILPCIENLGFERGKGKILPSYGELSQTEPLFQKHFVRYLRSRQHAPDRAFELDAYPIYLGYQWSTPIHIGILYAVSIDQSEKKLLFEQLQQWQEHSGYMTMIGPHFGLSRDYDEFVLGLAPALWALVAMLMHDSPDAVEYISRQCKLVLVELERAPIETSFFTAVWMLHIASSSDSTSEYYEYARNFMNERGGMPIQYLNEPIGMLSFNGGQNWSFDEPLNCKPVPSLLDFKALLKDNKSFDDITTAKIALAIDALMDEVTVGFWSRQLVPLLQADAGSTLSTPVTN